VGSRGRNRLDLFDEQDSGTSWPVYPVLVVVAKGTLLHPSSSRS